MTVAQTSIDAYHEAIESGLISRRRAEVLVAASRLESPFSQRDLFRAIGQPGENYGSVNARTVELEAMGVFRHVGHKEDHESKMTVKTYVITGEPVRPFKRPPRIPKESEVVAYLNALESPEALEALLAKTKFDLAVI